MKQTIINFLRSPNKDFCLSKLKNKKKLGKFGSFNRIRSKERALFVSQLKVQRYKQNLKYQY